MFGGSIVTRNIDIYIFCFYFHLQKYSVSRRGNNFFFNEIKDCMRMEIAGKMVKSVSTFPLLVQHDRF